MIRDADNTAQFLGDLRRTVDTKLIPAETAADTTGCIPPDIVAMMRKQGYFGWSIPSEYGGAGFTVEELVLGAFQIGRAAPAFRARVGANTGIGSQTLIDRGTSDQKRAFLPRLASGVFTAAFALTEPNAGSEASNISTTARKVEGGWVLDGEKAFITNAPIADLYTVFARTDPNSSRGDGIGAFLIERDTPGLAPGTEYEKLGQNGSPVGPITLQGCKVSDTSLLGADPNNGFRWAMETLTKQRIHLAGLTTGFAARALEEMVKHARERIQFGSAIGEFQFIQGHIADIRTAIFASRSMVLEAARAMDNGGDVRNIASMCKLFATETAVKAADTAVQVFGGSGFIKGSPAEQLFRDGRLFTLYEGTSEIHRATIGKLTQREAIDRWL